MQCGQTIIHTEGRIILTYTRNLEQQHNTAVVKSPLKIPPRPNGIIPVTITGHNLKGPVGYFISNQHLDKKLDPHIHVLGGIYNIKDKLTLHVLIAYYTHKHATFNKEQCIVHIDPFIEHMLQTTINSLTTQRMLYEHIQPDSLTPPLHTFLDDVRKSLIQLMETYLSQFAQDETSIGTTHLIKCKLTWVTKHMFHRGHTLSL